MTQAASRGWIASLDGLRGVAVGLVCLAHFGLGGIVPGGFGVTLFFFISGDLITGQLAAEVARRGRLDWRRFAIRRVLRLAPTALCYVVLAGAAFLALGGHIDPAGWLAALLHGANYFDLVAHYDNGGIAARHPFTILWSLAVEEHFYLLVPPLIGLCSRRRAIQALALLCLAAPLWRALIFWHAGPAAGAWLYKATDTRLDSLAWGALYALTARNRAVRRLIASPPASILAVCVLLATFALRAPWFRDVPRYTLQGAALFVLIPALIGHDSPLRRALETPVAMLVGRMSYAIYLWHWAALMLADAWAPAFSPAWIACAVSLTALLAAASYAAIERPMLRLRRRFGSHVPPLDALPAWHGRHQRA